MSDGVVWVSSIKKLVQSNVSKRVEHSGKGIVLILKKVYSIYCCFIFQSLTP